MSSQIVHHPVMCKEVIEFLAIRENGVYVDATLGLGGHSEAILSRLGTEGRLIGIDRDEEALRIAKERLNDMRVSFIKGEYSDIAELVRGLGVSTVDGILIDMGTSMHQLKSSERGFGFDADFRLDMRMDQSQDKSAWDIVNNYSILELQNILKDYGQEPRYRAIVKAIDRYRQASAINTCKELSSLILRVYGGRGKRHPATKTFQALRIAVNDEFNALNCVLKASPEILSHGGRLCVISYHSLEDRAVKHFFRDKGKDGSFKVLTDKPLRPTLEEIRRNKSARSAMLRAGERWELHPQTPQGIKVNEYDKD
ncbi:MAG: 16S rRNA (cytosine(1402)-N(4))-methyltransferase RsmH [Nitrospirae bacterium]|nr:16S rRNA (cytosine(1402)-N(4))-methyltransferase RsmH [Nitrospirota bacterium]